MERDKTKVFPRTYSPLELRHVETLQAHIDEYEDESWVAGDKILRINPANEPGIFATYYDNKKLRLRVTVYKDLSRELYYAIMGTTSDRRLINADVECVKSKFGITRCVIKKTLGGCLYLENTARKSV